jgi:phosphoglycerate dehydrogenase-like enzyme
MMRVAVLDDYQGRAAGYADWDSLGPEVEVEFFKEPIDAAELPARLGGFEVLVLMRERTRFPDAVLRRLPNLRLLVTTGMRNASVDADYLREHGIVYCGTQGTSAPTTEGVPTTVEVAWALILAVCKRVTIEDRAVREGRWQLDLPRNLAGSTLGLAGLGNLGAAMAGPARAFGMDTIAWSEHLTPRRADEVGVRRVTKQELLAGADVLSVHLVLSERTRGLFGAAELAQMKPTAALVNTSRGPIVDEAALIAALRGGTIAAAGLDVFDQEPLPSSCCPTSATSPSPPSGTCTARWCRTSRRSVREPRCVRSTTAERRLGRRPGRLTTAERRLGRRPGRLTTAEGRLGRRPGRQVASFAVENDTFLSRSIKAWRIAAERCGVLFPFAPPGR